LFDAYGEPVLAYATWDSFFQLRRGRGNATRQQLRAMQNDADTERSKSKDNIHEPPRYEKRVEATELGNYVPQLVQVRWVPEMEGEGGVVAIIDNPTW